MGFGVGNVVRVGVVQPQHSLREILSEHQHVHKKFTRSQDSRSCRLCVYGLGDTS